MVEKHVSRNWELSNSQSHKPKEYSEVLGKLNSASSLNEHYSLSEWTDQPTLELHLNLHNTKKTITIYGSLDVAEVRKKAPKEFLGIYNFITKFKYSESTIWHPEFIEIMVWPYEHAPEKSIIWPVNWPDTTSETTRERGDSFSIYLPFEHKQALADFLNTRNAKVKRLVYLLAS